MNRADTEAGALLDELAELVQDTLAWVEWEELRGATSLPRSTAARTPSPLPLAADPSPAVRTPTPRPHTTPARAEPPRPPAPPPRAEPLRPTASPSPPSAAASDAWGALARAPVLTGLPLQAALKVAVGKPGAKERLDAVREVLGDCVRCGLHRERKSLVFGVGDPAARLVVVGEGPGREEDERGEPFVGPAGGLLDAMLERVLGLRREQVYILNMVKCRPPNNRNPEHDELLACRPFVRAQLAAIRPELVLVLGSVASKALLEQPISAVRGQWQELRWPGGSSRVMPTFHPAYLLRKPEDKRLTFEDLKLLKGALGERDPR